MIAIVTLLSGMGRLSQRMIVGLLGDLLGLTISDGQISRLQRIGRESLQPAYEEIANALNDGVACADSRTAETCRRLSNHYYRLFVFAHANGVSPTNNASTGRCRCEITGGTRKRRFPAGSLPVCYNFAMQTPESPDIPLRQLPSVTAVLGHAAVEPLVAEQGRHVVLGWIRGAINELRESLKSDGAPLSREFLLEQLADRVVQEAVSTDRRRLGPVINATGVVLHTGLGRAPLSKAATGTLVEIAGAANLEVDLETNQRRYRGHQLLPVLQSLTNCEDALIVNNNAAATLLTLQALCAGREVILSRGQLVEIGGSFRLPEIFELSGAKLHEIGTTNRTNHADYESAISDRTAAIMRVHPSNYRIEGFTHSPATAELSALARKRNLVMIDDIGSGCIADLSAIGLPAEPTFADSLAAGADIVLGSGDKLLGGPQSGIILGRTELVERIRSHPLARAVRVGKLTLAALAATLDSYVRGAAQDEIPVLQMLAATQPALLDRAHAIRDGLEDSDTLQVEVQTETAFVGGGSLPTVELPTAVLMLRHSRKSPERLARDLRTGSIRLYGRVKKDAVLIDLRSVLPDDDSRVSLALRLAAGK